MTRLVVAGAAPSERFELGGHEVEGRDGSDLDIAFERMDGRFRECVTVPAVRWTDAGSRGRDDVDADVCVDAAA